MGFTSVYLWKHPEKSCKSRECACLFNVFFFIIIVHVINNFWMRLSMIARIMKAKVCVIFRSQRLRWITQTQTEAKGFSKAKGFAALITKISHVKF